MIQQQKVMPGSSPFQHPTSVQYQHQAPPSPYSHGQQNGNNPAAPPSAINGNTIMSSRRAQLQAMQQRLQQSRAVAAAPSNNQSPITRSTSADGLSRKVHQFGPVPPTPPSFTTFSKFSSSGSTGSMSSSDDDSLLVTPRSNTQPPPPPPVPKNIKSGASPLSTNNNTLRLIQKLVEATEEKAAAIKRATAAEKNLLDFKKQTEALQFQQQHQHSAKTSSFFEMRKGAAIMLMIEISRRLQEKRIRSAFQKLRIRKECPLPVSILEKELPKEEKSILLKSHYPITQKQSPPPIQQHFFSSALKYISLEYKSNIASYTIRHPFSPQEGLLPSQQYQETATIYSPATFELIIDTPQKLDFILSHSTLFHASTKQAVTTLGKIYYITKLGMEEEYDLEYLFQEACYMRESFCHNVAAAALVLQEHSSSIPATITSNATAKISSAEVVDVGIQTDATQLLSSQGEVKPAVSKQQKQTDDNFIDSAERSLIFGKPTSVQDEIMSNFIIHVFKGMHYFIVLVTYKIPLFGLKFSCYAAVLIGIWSVIWYYVSIDNGAWEMMRGYSNVLQEEGYVDFYKENLQS